VLAQQAPPSPTPPAVLAPPGTVAASTETTTPLEEITVTSARLSLIGSATTASEGLVDAGELALTPAYRPGQLLETVPGLVVTLHSGEGKANQYLMRGYTRRVQVSKPFCSFPFKPALIEFVWRMAQTNALSYNVAHVGRLSHG